MFKQTFGLPPVLCGAVLSAAVRAGRSSLEEDEEPAAEEDALAAASAALAAALVLGGGVGDLLVLLVLGRGGGVTVVGEDGVEEGDLVRWRLCFFFPLLFFPWDGEGVGVGERWRLFFECCQEICIV